MFDRIKKNWISYHLKNLDKRPLSKLNNKQNIQKVLLLFSENQTESIFHKRQGIAKILNLSIDKVRTLSVDFSVKNNKNSNIISLDDFNLFGKISKHSPTNQLIKEETDLLINCSPEPHDILKYLTLICKSSFKVGFLSNDTGIFDLMINVKDQWDLFCSELEKYLVILKKIKS